MNKPLRRLPLLGKMLIFILPLVVLPLLIVATLSIRRGMEAVERTAEKNLELVAKAAGARLDQVFAHTHRLQRVVSTMTPLVEACAAPSNKRQPLLSPAEIRLKQVVDMDPYLALAYIADDQGICIASTSTNMVGRNYKATRDYMRQALTGESIVSDLAVGITTKEPGVFFAGPIHHADGRLIGVIVLKMKGEIIDRICADVSGQTPGSGAMVIDANEIFISHPNAEQRFKSVGALKSEQLNRIDPKLQYGVNTIESSGNNDIATALRKGLASGCLSVSTSKGVPLVVGYARMQQRPWTVAVIQPRELFDQPMQKLKSEQRWWILSLCLLAALSTAGITYLFLKPVRSLREATLRATAGDWSARANVVSRDELGDLAIAFNTMMPALQDQARIKDDLRMAQELQRQTELHAKELTAQKNALLIAEERTRQILESAAEGIFGVDTSGRITFVNPSACRLLGYSADEMINQPSHSLIHHHQPDGSDYPAETCPMYAAYTRGQASRIDNEHLWRKDGSSLPVEYGATPIMKDGDIIGAVISFTDITERKRAEIELRDAKEAAESATRAKSDFLANMSHEIRTPMNAIIGLSHLALKTDLTGRQRDYVAKIHNAGTSLLTIINDILDFSKIEAGKLEIETTEFSLDEVITSVSTVTSMRAHEKGLEFLISLPTGLPPTLKGDPLRIGQILTNLVNNAIKFTNTGEIRISIKEVERTGDKICLQFTVQDTGMGMTREQAGRLFQPFMQADASTTRKHGGTGLGLSICRRLVELMGGQIGLESEPNAGSTFFFTLWLGISTKDKSSHIVPAALRSLRVLVVDDNAAARDILLDTLRSVFITADAVASGPEALDAIRQHSSTDPYSLVFMDWRMPRMDGIQATRLIKTDPALAPAPAVVIVTAFGREEIRNEAEKAGVDGFLVKPVTPSMVVDSLVQVFAPSQGELGRIASAAKGEDSLSGLHLLLAEDNEINQQIAIELLEGAGAIVDVVNNGQQAVDKLLQGPLPPPYHLVLMDIQMPELDGLQATRLIRAESRLNTLPIVAMTAHATAEERKRCLEAGMCDHISKPINPDDLFETIQRCHHPHSVSPKPSPVHPPENPLPGPPAAGDVPVINGIDTADGLKRVAGNHTLYYKLLRDFMTQLESSVGQISSAWAEGNPSLAERLAHTLKGVAGNLGARTIQIAAGTVETAIRNGESPDQFAATLRALEEALTPVLHDLKRALPDCTPATQPAPSGTIVDPAQTQSAAKRLLGLLAESDPGAGDFIVANAIVLRPLFHDNAWAEIVQLVQDYQFSDAEAVLKAAIQEFPVP